MNQFVQSGIELEHSNGNTMIERILQFVDRMNYHMYSKEKIINAINSLNKRLMKNTVDNTVEVYYDGSIPRALDAILVLCYVNNVPRDDKDVQILLSAYYQLDDYGFVGEMTD